jgi:hypothetical protein
VNVVDPGARNEDVVPALGDDRTHLPAINGRLIELADSGSRGSRQGTVLCA